MSNLCVFDTNVIVSAAIFEQSIPRQALNQALAREIILISEPIV